MKMDSTKFERNSSLDNNAWSEVENKYKLKTSFQYSPFSNCPKYTLLISPHYQKKNYVTIVSNFSWVEQSSREKLKTMVVQNENGKL